MPIPLRKTWSTKDPERLQEELQELQRNIIDELAKLGARTRVKPSTQDTVFAGYDDVVRLSPTSAGQQLVLPAAVPARAGATVEAIIESADGAVTVEAVDSLVNEEESITFVARIGRALFGCNGSGWFLATMLPSGFITSADILDGTIVNADISASAAIALSKLATQAANTVVANGTGSSAVPTAFTVGTNSVLGRVAGNLVAAGLVNAQVDASAAIALSKLATQAANTVTANATAGAAVPTAVSVGTNSVLGRVAGNIVAAALVNAQVDAAAAIALSKLASQAADTFVGRLAGTGVPAAQSLADIDSTSIVYDAASHTFQRAAFTSEVTAAQNVNALTITRSTNFDWTGEHSYAESASGPTLAAGQGAFWPLNVAPTAPMFTDDINATWRLGYAAVQSITANAAATNATTNLSGGSFTIPANTLRAGSVYRATLWFDFVMPAAPPTLTAELLIGGSVVETVLLTPLALAITLNGTIEAVACCRTIGASGTVKADVQLRSSAGTNEAACLLSSRSTGTAHTVDTTASQTLELRVRMTTAVASATLTVVQGYTERLR